MRRILKPGGKLYVSVPDMDVLCRLYISPLLSMEERVYVMRMMFGGQTDPHDFHHVGWNRELLERMALKEIEVPFKHVDVVRSFGLFNDTSEHEWKGVRISLNAIVTK
eukprot:TRINITY_DN12916_c0_g1_i10.p1 TRINITY_DN12916_c0_g1~~TRINITY_DN12916_c0_g1_i10.p1  ORF type:complete len:108 (-),score=26.28 TRINITY_DN12916_c0_g1_i10:351-674(-)